MQDRTDSTTVCEAPDSSQDATVMRSERKCERFVWLMVALALAGCDQSHLITPLEVKNAQLTVRVDELNQKMAEMEGKFASLEAKWKTFEQSFDADKRQELAKNIAATEQMVAQATRNVDASTGVLKRLRDLESNVVKLRDLCQQHASEAADANLVGNLKDVVARVDSDLKQLKTSLDRLSRVDSKIQRLESSVRSVDHKVRSLEMKVR
jgi:phage shock protein A